VNDVQAGLLPLRFGFVKAFLVRGAGKHVLVDSGTADNSAKIAAQLERGGVNLKDIGLIVVTHAHEARINSSHADQESAQGNDDPLDSRPGLVHNQTLLGGRRASRPGFRVRCEKRASRLSVRVNHLGAIPPRALAVPSAEML
jgi:hypothetical protein